MHTNITGSVQHYRCDLFRRNSILILEGIDCLRCCFEYAKPLESVSARGLIQNISYQAAKVRTPKETTDTVAKSVFAARTAPRF